MAQNVSPERRTNRFIGLRIALQSHFSAPLSSAIFEGDGDPTQ